MCTTLNPKPRTPIKTCPQNQPGLLALCAAHLWDRAKRHLATEGVGSPWAHRPPFLGCVDLKKSGCARSMCSTVLAKKEGHSRRSDIFRNSPACLSFPPTLTPLQQSESPTPLNNKVVHCAVQPPPAPSPPPPPPPQPLPTLQQTPEECPPPPPHASPSKSLLTPKPKTL